MDLGFLDQSSTVTPLLVRLYDSQKLKGLAEDKSATARHELISAISELLEMDLSSRESELVADVMIGLLRQAELDLRQALAERLSAQDNVPLRLILQLANDEIRVAQPVLTHSPVLGDLDLIYIIKTQGPSHWQYIAQREAMSFQVMNMLADTRDFDTALALAENKKIKLSSHALVALSDIAQNSDVLALPLLQRSEVSVDLAKRLYRFVGESVKAYIQKEYNITDTSVSEALDDVMDELAEAAKLSGEFAPSASMLKAADRYKQKGLLTMKLMLSALRRGQISSFIAQYARYSGLSSRTVLEILSQPSGQGLAVACKAFEVSKEDFISIYLLTNRIRNKGRMADLKDMTKAIGYYDRIAVDVALGIIKNSLIEELKK
jgi:uncharacterized protein (DUF2336 family)